jgi:phosphate transport system protein
MAVLEAIPDPEIPVLTITDLGIVRGIEHDPPRVMISPTYTGCPATVAIENAILILIATQQPIARDLRMLAAMMEVITELERMGDYAKGISRVTLRLGDSAISIPSREFDQMCELSVNMLHRALGAFIAGNLKVASAIPLEDDEVDSLYNSVYREVLNMMIANPAIIDQASLLLWVAHNLERTADRVTNICERTVFIATGELLEFDTAEDQDEEGE